MVTVTGWGVVPTYTLQTIKLLTLPHRKKNTSVFIHKPPKNCEPKQAPSHRVTMLKRSVRASSISMKKTLEPATGFVRSVRLQEKKQGKPHINDWLVVSTHLKNISQNGNLPQIGVKIPKMFETTT